MNAGWPFEVFQRATGYDLRQEWPAEMNQLASQGWAKIEAERFRLTRQGLRFADAAAEQFLRSNRALAHEGGVQQFGGDKTPRGHRRAASPACSESRVRRHRNPSAKIL